MANTNRPSGMSPVRTGDGNSWNQQATLYWIPSSGDSNVYSIGDLVKSAEGSDANGVPKVVKAAAGNVCRGVIVGVQADPNALQTIAIPATKAHDYYVFVVDDPGTVFDMTDDGITSANLVTTAIGQNCNFTVANPTSPVPTSATVITSSTIGTTTTLPLKIVGIMPIEGNTAAPFARWLVRFNAHEFLGTGTVGV